MLRTGQVLWCAAQRSGKGRPNQQAKTASDAASARTSVPCLSAPSPARMKEISLESTMWCAPSCRTKRSPESLWPVRGPFSQASRNPCEWRNTTSGVSGFPLQMHHQEPPNILVLRSLTFLCVLYFMPHKKIFKKLNSLASRWIIPWKRVLAKGVSWFESNA